ncbi:MAG: GntR family transcriptional regulator [Hyphomicrobiaceae bacterium]|nr:MAG: GntR family transcriptional regulator [Hyphomicrobiaceae bacterium]
MVVVARQALAEPSLALDDVWKLEGERPATIAERIVAALRQAIVTLRLKPGMALSEQDLAEKFKVSRQPVREAFIRLGSSGLIAVRPQRATLVTRISVGMIEEAHFVRQVLEVEIVRRAARRASEKDIADLLHELKQQRQAGRDHDARRFFVLDEQFHRRLAVVAGRPNSWRTIEDGKAQLDRARFLTLLEGRPLKQRIEQHAKIIEAVAAGRPEQAARAMRTHLSGMMQALPTLARKWPDYFDSPALSASPSHRAESRGRAIFE